LSTPAKKSAAELFASRTRQVVPPRTDDITESFYSPEPSKATTPVEAISESQAFPAGDSGLKALQNELELLPQVGNFQLRFEEPIKKQIKEVANQTGLTPETLLQGLWVIAQNQPVLMAEAIAEAQEHHQRRERAAELKNSITRLSKLLKKLKLS
jgi:glycosyltransferase involved in cell wall biosynthesis